MAEKREGSFFTYGEGKEYIDSVLSGERLSNNLKSIARAIAGRKFKQLDPQDRDIKSARAKRVVKDAIAEAKKQDLGMSSTGRGRPSTAADRRGSNATLKTKPKAESTKKEPTSIAEAKRMGKSYFIGKDGERKAAVTRGELEQSGLSLREYLNKQQGKTPVKKAKGGVAKKAYSRGGMANCGASVPPNRKAKS